MACSGDPVTDRRVVDHGRGSSSEPASTSTSPASVSADEGVALSRQDVEAVTEVCSRQVAAQGSIKCHGATVRARVAQCAVVGSDAYPTDGEERSTGMPDVADAVVSAPG
jgi:hypothetical protein